MTNPYGSTGSYSAALALLQQTRDQVLPFFAAPADQLARSYAPGKWTLHQVLLHIADTEAVMLDRLQRILADAQPLLWPFDENRWAQQLHYSQRDIALAGRLFSAARDTAIELARQAGPDFPRSGFHPERGPVPYLDHLDTIACHTAHHLAQLRAIAEGRTWSPSPSK